MAITTGARRGELEKLCWCDIDLQQQQAHCKDTKNGTDKVLHLTDIVVAELKNHRALGHGLIFGSPHNPLSIYDFRNESHRALEQAEIALFNEKGEKLVFHSLRHAFFQL